MLPRIFNMFTQGDRPLEDTRGGLGVGLTLVRSLVELHEGSVEAHSKGPGQGSEFIVRLPLAPPVLRSEPVAAKPDGQPARAKPRRILVVDDNEDQVQSLVKLLKLLGHEVDSAHDGLSALETAVAFAPDLALVDIGLPRMNGYEVARRIRANPALQHVMLVAQTGWGQEEDRHRSQEAGFDRHLVKPVEISTLQELLMALETEK
jgi:CheY-like chemotaxis protein